MKKITIYTSTRAKGNIKVIFLDVIRFYTYGVEISVIYSLQMLNNRYILLREKCASDFFLTGRIL